MQEAQEEGVMVSKKVQEEEKKGVEGIRLSKAGGRRRERGCRSKLSKRVAA